MRREITYALRSLPWISVPTVALFFAEVRGYSKLYDNIEDSPYGKLLPHTPSTGRHPLPDTHVTSLGPPISPDDGTPCMSPKKSFQVPPASSQQSHLLVVIQSSLLTHLRRCPFPSAHDAGLPP